MTVTSNHRPASSLPPMCEIFVNPPPDRFSDPFEQDSPAPRGVTILEARRALAPLRAQLEQGYFSVPRLCVELDGSAADVLSALSELREQGMLEPLQEIPYLRITRSGHCALSR